MQPIIPEQAAQEGGTRAIQLASHIISTDEFSMLQTNSITEAELAERLSEIAEEYWPGRRWAERLGPNDLRDTLMPVADATTQLLQILEKSPNYAR